MTSTTPLPPVEPAPRVLKATIYGDETTRPVAPPPVFDSIADELRKLPRWVGWRFAWVVNKKGEGKWSKVPVDMNTGRNAKSNDPTTWADFDTARAVYEAGTANVDGIGFMLGDGWLGVDLDDCRDLATGVVDPWAQTIIDRLDTYTEVSPSGTGVKLIGCGTLPAGIVRQPGKVEAYSSGRYFTVTGVAV